jgi:hypothetical protein
MPALTMVGFPDWPATAAGLDASPLLGLLLGTLGVDVVLVTRQAAARYHGIVGIAAAHDGRHRCLLR